jgi:hypothetical protein
MLSPAPSQQHLLSESASNEISVHLHCLPCDLMQQDLEQSGLNFAITAKKCDSTKCETKAKINVSCINCDFEEKRDWQGRIIGKGITGSLNALLKRIKYKNKLLKRNTPLMRLLTICDNCCIELDWDGKPDQDHILSVGRLHKISASLVLRLSYKEIEEVISSKSIIMGALLMNAIKTVGINGQEKEWNLLFQTI